jgi:AcrR family transcriptional regulator
MSSRPTKTPKQSAGRLLKQTQALRLRAHGHSFRDIAKALGCSRGTAHALVKDAFAAERKGISEAKADLVETEILRCDTYLQAIAKQVQAGSVRAIDTALRVAERRAKLLGLDAPTLVAPTMPDGSAMPPVLDLSRLSVDQLETLEAIYQTCTVDPAPDAEPAPDTEA